VRALNFLQGLPCFSGRDVPSSYEPSAVAIAHTRDEARKGLLLVGFRKRRIASASISRAQWPTFTTVMNTLPPVQVT
jgi:hypothetical protein